MSNVGNITYTVDIDTAKVVTGTSQANKQLDSLESGMKKTDIASKNATKSLGDLSKKMSSIDGSAASKLSKVADSISDSAKASSDAKDPLTAIVDTMVDGAQSADVFSFSMSSLAQAIAGVISAQAITSLQKLAEQFTLLESRVKRLSASAEDARKNYAALLQISSAGGSDLATTIMLWESLTASLTSLGVTRDQVLSLTDTLQKIGKIGGSSAEEISAALRQFSQSVAGGTLRAEEFNSIIEQMPELGRKIADGLGIPFNELRQQMLDGKLTIDRVLTALYEQTGKVNAEFRVVPRTVGAASNSIVNAMGAAISKIDQAAKASQTLAAALDAIAKGIRLSSGQLDDQQKLAKLVTDRATAEQQYATQVKYGLKSTAESTKSRIDGYNAEIKAIQDRRIAQQKAESDALKIKAPENKEQSDSEKSLDVLRKEAELTRLVGVERAKLQAKQKLGPSAKPEEIEEAQRLAVEIYNLENARKQEGATNKKITAENASIAKKAATEQQKELEDTQKVYGEYGAALAAVGQSARELAMDQADLKLAQAKAIPTEKDIQLVRDLAAAQFDATQGKQLVGQFDPVAAETTDFDKKAADLEIANKVYVDGQKLLSDEAYFAAKTQMETEHNAAMAQLEIDRFAAQSAGNASMVAGFEALATSGGQALAGLLSGTTSLKDAMGGVANTVLNAVIGSFVQSGIEWAKVEAGKMLATKATEAAQIGGIAAVTTAQTGATVAIAATTTATAATTGTAVAASMAPAAGLSSIASFGGAAVIGGAALLATMALAKSSGGRQYGGGVAAGGMYRVNETGAPEIFNAANGRQYMMPNQRGEVVSNKDATSGGGSGSAPIIYINNYTGQSASQSSKFSEADKAWVVEVVVGDMMSGGKTSRATNQTTGTRRQGT